MSGVWAIVVAAGRGDRFADGAHDIAKQFVELDGVRIVDRSVATAARACDGVVLVLAPGVEWDGVPVDAVVTGGATRSDSVRAGLAAIPDAAEVVVVHDAARPLAADAVFGAVIDAVRAGSDAAVPALPVPDTIKRVAGERVIGTLVRDELVSVQTPQGFRAAALRDAHAASGEASDDAALVEARGGVVVVVEGDPDNFKITTPRDFVVAGALLEARRPERI